MKDTEFTDFLILCGVVMVMALAFMSQRSEFVAPTRHSRLATVEDVSAWASSWGHICRVQGVIDGDQLLCNDSTVVRLIGVDAPETTYGRPGIIAKQALERLVPPGTQMVMEFDEVLLDRHGRVYAYLILRDNQLLNEVVVASGFAVARLHRPNRRYEYRLQQAGDEAQRANRGLWPDPIFRCFAQNRTSEQCLSERVPDS